MKKIYVHKLRKKKNGCVVFSMQSLHKFVYLGDGDAAGEGCDCNFWNFFDGLALENVVICCLEKGFI